MRQTSLLRDSHFEASKLWESRLSFLAFHKVTLTWVGSGGCGALFPARGPDGQGEERPVPKILALPPPRCGHNWAGPCFATSLQQLWSGGARPAANTAWVGAAGLCFGGAPPRTCSKEKSIAESVIFQSVIPLIGLRNRWLSEGSCPCPLTILEAKVYDSVLMVHFWMMKLRDFREVSPVFSMMRILRYC